MRTMALNTAGYDLYEVTREEWILHVKENGPIYHGTLKKIALHAIKNMGFKVQDFEIATQEMVKMGHNGAHFGMHGGFIFTFQREFAANRAS